MTLDHPGSERGRWQGDPSWRRELAAEFGVEVAESVGELLSRQAAARGDRVAVSMFEQGTQLTYGELDRQVSRLADGFRSIGVSPGSRVAVMLPSRIEFPVTWLALARMGAVAVPVNPRYTPSEVGRIVEDVEPTYMVLEGSRTRPQGVPQAVWVGQPSSAGGHLWSELLEGGSPDFTPDRPVTRTDLLTIQYTSGTTGLPKGGMQSHRTWLVAGILGAFQRGMPPLMSWLGEAPFFYFDGLWPLMAMLSSGGTLHRAERYSSSRFLQRIRGTRAEHAYLPVPLPEPSPAQMDHAIRLFTGFCLTPELVREVEARFGATVREGYGMTEIGVCMRVPLSNADEAAIGTCGLPCPTYEVKVVGTDGKEVPRGQIGELWVRGPGVIDGYWRRPEAHAATFVDGWFRTGDLFVHEATGYYRYVDRIKEMIKRSAENISAHEVEEVIRGYPDVEDVVVVPVPDDYRDQEVKAIVKLRPGVDASRFDPAALRTHCEKYLAAFKCPRFIAVIDEFPRTGSGKLDKMALRAVENPRSGSWDQTVGDRIA